MQVTLQPNDHRVIAGSVEVKVANATATAGSISVQCPNVPAAPYAIAANGSKNIQIPLGDSTFTNTGTVALQLTW